MLILFNFLTIDMIIDIVIGFDFNRYLLHFFEKNNIAKAFLAIVLLIIWIFIDRIIALNNGPKKLEKTFKNETPKEKLRNTLFIWCYIISSFLLLIFSVYLARRLQDSGFTVCGYLHNFFTQRHS